MYHLPDHQSLTYTNHSTPAILETGYLCRGFGWWGAGEGGCAAAAACVGLGDTKILWAVPNKLITGWRWLGVVSGLGFLRPCEAFFEPDRRIER